MADVAERGQVILMAALGMAILFVTLALILNTSIYTENLATRGSDIAGGSEAARFVDTARDGVAGAMEYANHHNHTGDTEPHGDLHRNVSAALERWDNASGRHFAHRGHGVAVSLVGTRNGTRIAQESEDEFTDKDGDGNWTVVENVNRTRAFTIYASNDSGSVVPFDDEPFNVTVANGSDEWRLFIASNDSDSSIDVELRSTGDVDETCPAGSEAAWIDVTSGKVAGADCEGLQFAEGIEPPYNVSFHNGENVSGNYSLVVDNRTLGTSTSPHLHDDSTSDDPFAVPAIYTSNVTVDYRSPQLLFNGTIRVAPGEPDD